MDGAVSPRRVCPSSIAIAARPKFPGDLMPKSIQEILDHADELANRFED